MCLQIDPWIELNKFKFKRLGGWKDERINNGIEKNHKTPEETHYVKNRMR